MDQANEGGDIRAFPDTEQTRNDVGAPGQPATDDMTCERCGAQFEDQKTLQDHVKSHESLGVKLAA